jgi:polar amino acid transport system substrate-binding protein
MQISHKHQKKIRAIMKLTYFSNAILSSLLLTIISFSSHTHASAPTNNHNSLFIVTPSWKNFTEEDGSGFYFELLKKIFEPLGVSIQFQITPWPRSVAMVSLNQADALVGSYKEQVEQFHYPQQPIWIDISAVAFKKTQTNWVGSESLKNKNVGWIRGYGYDAYINVDMNISKLIDNKQAWKLLELDRIDFYLDSLTDLKLYMADNNIDRALFQIENILTKSLYVRFGKTEKGKVFAENFDQGILELQNNGQLKALYLKWGYMDYYQAFIQKH